MIKVNTLSAAVAASLVLAGCGGSSNSNSEPPVVPSVTAIDGYLQMAKIYKQDAEGNCDTDGDLLGQTNASGKLEVELALLKSGYCVVADTQTIDSDNPGVTLSQGFTLFAPAPEVLGQGTNAVVSPFTSYLQKVIADGGDVATAKSNLLSGFGLNASDEANLELLVGDYIAAKTDADKKTSAEKLHRLAQVSVDVTAKNGVEPTPAQWVNMAAVLADELNNEDANLDGLATYLAAEIDQLDNTDNVAALKTAVANGIASEMPKLTADASALAKQLSDAAENSSFVDTKGLVIEMLNLDGIDIGSTTLGENAHLTLTATKSGSERGAQEVANTGNDAVAFENGTLSIDEMVINQSGDFGYRLSLVKTVGEKTYRSNGVMFDLAISNELVPNQAPVYAGNDAEAPKAMLGLLGTDAKISPPLSIPGVIELPGQLTLNKGFLSLDGLFTDAQPGALTYSIEGSNGSKPDLLCIESLGGCSLSFTVDIPAEGEQSYSVKYWASDSLGAISDKPFNFVVNINADEEFSVTFDDGTGGDNGGDYGTPFNGTLITESALATAATDIASVLTGVDAKYTLDQVFVVKEYQCNESDKCVETSTNVPPANYALEANDFLTIKAVEDGAGNTVERFVATDTKVTSETTITLTPTLSDKSVNIYLVDNTNTIVTGGIEGYGNQFNLVLKVDGSVAIEVGSKL